MVLNLRDPLRITVVWAEATGTGSDTVYGRELAKRLARRLGLIGMERDGVGMRVPVFVRWHPWQADAGSLDAPRPIDLRAADRNLVVIVHDDLFQSVARSSESWAKWAKHLDSQRVPERDLIAIVATSTNYTPLAPFEHIQAFKPTEKEIGNRHFDRMTLLLLGSLLIKDRGNDMYTGRPFTIFLSHAKKDGEAIAEMFLDYLKNRLAMYQYRV